MLHHEESMLECSCCERNEHEAGARVCFDNGKRVIKNDVLICISSHAAQSEKATRLE